jgi:hypothetical protein
MGKAIFLSLSVALFIGYSLIANALGFDGDPLDPLSSPQSTSSFVDEQCLNEETGQERLLCRAPVMGPIVKFILGTGQAVSAAADIFSGFFQLITFQAPGQSAASLVTLLIFGPLTFANGFIIFNAVRGNS